MDDWSMDQVISHGLNSSNQTLLQWIILSIKSYQSNQTPPVSLFQKMSRPSKSVHNLHFLNKSKKIIIECND